MIARARALWAAVLVIALGGGWALWPGGASGHYPPAPTRPCGTDAVLQKDAWQAIQAPPGMPQITGQTAGGPDGKLILATNGRKVMRSADGGCTWGTGPVYTVPTGDVDTGGALPTVSAVVFPDGDASRAFLLLDGIGKLAAPQLMASDDGGRTWQPAGDGLPATGHYQDVVGHGSHLYMSVAYNDNAGDNDPAGLSGALYRSTDGGKTWEKRSGGNQIERVTVDPGNPESVWVVRADHSVQRSDDGGQSFAAVTIAQDPDDATEATDPTKPKTSNWRDLALARGAGGVLTVVLAAADTRIANISRIVASEDGGRSFKDLPIGGLGPVTGVTFGNSSRQILIVSGSDSTAFHGPGLRAYDIDYARWRDVDDMSLESLREARPVELSAASRGHTGLRALQFRRNAPGEAPPQPDLIARYTPPDPPPDTSLFERARCVPNVRPTAGPVPERKNVTFEPDDLSVLLKPGKPSRFDLKAALKAVPTPLDAYFLIDGSNSSDAARDGVKCSLERLARELVERGVDARFGVATFADRYERRYERLLDLSPYGQPLINAIDGLLPREGRGTPIRSALYQTATGAGMDVTDNDINPTAGQENVPVHIDKGLNASYRPGALHTAIVVADEPYEEDVSGEPSREDVVAALKAKNILSIGIQVTRPYAETANDPDHSPPNQLLLNQQLRYFASGSGAVAPPGGVDCNGTGRPDLQPGDPLVCQVDNNGVRETMIDTLVTLLTQFRENADVRLVPQKTDGLSVSVEGGEAKNVNIRHASELGGTAVMSCTADQVGQTFDVVFGVVVGDRTVGTLPAEARCGRKVAPVAASKRPRRASPPGPGPSPAPAKSPSPAPSSPAVPAPAPPHPAAILSPAPPPPAPAPVTPTPAASPSGAQAPASMPSASAATNPAPGAVAAAQQRERGAQVAVADHAMTAWRPSAQRRDVVPPPALITLGLGVCGAFGFFGWSAATRRRPRVAPERVRVRR